MLETSKRMREARKSQGMDVFRFLMRIYERFFDTTGADYRYPSKPGKCNGRKYFDHVLVA